MGTTRTIKTVAVQFPNACTNYFYLCKSPIAIGDEVVANGCVVKVVGVSDYGHPNATKWVAKIDRTEERAQSSKAQRAHEIKIRLQVIEAELKLLERYKWVASKSAEAKRLLTELKGLSK